MENLLFDDLWGNLQQHGVCGGGGNSLESGGADYNIITGTGDLSDVLFSPQFLHSFKTAGALFRDERDEAAELSTPTVASADSAASGHVAGEDPRDLWLPLPVVDATVVPVACSTWMDTTTALNSQPPALISTRTKPVCGLIIGEDVGTCGYRSIVRDVEDDGVSAIQSENMGNLSSGGAIVSSGESADHSSSALFLPRKHGDGRPSCKRKNSCDSSGSSICDILRWDSPAKSGAGGLHITFGEPAVTKRAKPEKQYYHLASSIDFRRGAAAFEPDAEAVAHVKEAIYRAAAMRPVILGREAPALQKPKRKNVRISSDPQTVAARQRRERISERLSVLQRLVPGGSKMDTATMLDEAASYLKFLKSQVSALESFGGRRGLMEAKAGKAAGLLLPFGQPFRQQQAFPMQANFYP